MREGGGGGGGPVEAAVDPVNEAVWGRCHVTHVTRCMSHRTEEHVTRHTSRVTCESEEGEGLSQERTPWRKRDAK